MSKKIFLMTFLIFICFFITACNKSENKDNIPPVEENHINIVNLESNSRPFAITINNHPSALKVQTGLSKSYLIYEFPVEYGLSRTVAFFKDVLPEKVGTVRSARHDFLDYMLENDAIFVHFGWSKYAKQEIKSLKINNLDGNTSDPEPFWRENPAKLAKEHTVYGNLVKAKEKAEKKGYSLTTNVKPPLNYSVDEININEQEGSVSANSINIAYSNGYYVTFKYNTEEKRYYRYVNNKAHTDYFTKEHYSGKNIIIVRYGYKYKDSGIHLDLYNVGTGEGYYITNGYAVPITWTKKDRNSQTMYTYKDGTEVKVNDGNTYIMHQLTNKKTTIK